jgi:predicted DNA binding CopG/RHH family protein
MTDLELAAWLESDEGLKFLEQADWQPARFRLADPSLVPVTIRLPEGLRERLRRMASARSMGYQTLARQWLIERCNAEEMREWLAAAPEGLGAELADLDEPDRTIVMLRIEGHDAAAIGRQLRPTLSPEEVVARLQTLSEQFEQRWRQRARTQQETLALLRAAP